MPTNDVVNTNGTNSGGYLLFANKPLSVPRRRSRMPQRNKRTWDLLYINNKTQQNSKCRLCGDRDKTINHIMSECSKLAQKEYKARHDWVGKVIHWEMSRKFQFDHTNKWYMHNPAPFLENDLHKLLWNFNIQTDHLIPARRPDIIIINNKKKKRESAKLSTLMSRQTTE